MFWSKIATVSACAAVVAAHGGHSGIKLSGNPRALRELAREGVVSRWEPALSRPVAGVSKRQTANPERCGEGVGSCQEGYCCSASGWCGNTEEYCWAPDCQINFGDGCDANQKPSGADTSGVKRTKLGKIEYGGAGIYDCVNEGDIAITYDDGPFQYTDDLLDIFKKYDAKATFFINGNNKGKGMINDPEKPWGDIIKRMAAEGHQIASHSWSHQNYSQITEEQFEDQIIWNEIAINDIVGFFPTYYRPPYSICPESCQEKLAELGYHIIYFDLDTEGYLHDDPLKIQQSKDIWDKAVEGTKVCNNNFLTIEHDLQHQVVYNLTEYMIRSLIETGYRSVTVGECLGDPASNWYRTVEGSLPAYNFEPRPGTGVCNGNASAVNLSSIPTETVPPLTTSTSSSATNTATGASDATPTPGAASSLQGSSVLAMAAAGLVLPMIL